MPTALIKAPGVAPLSILEARAHVRQDDSYDDARLGAFLLAAAASAQTETGRALVASRWQLTLDSFPGPVAYAVPWGRPYGIPDSAILLERAPLIRIVSIDYTDMGGAPQTLAPSAYTVVSAGDLARITPVFGTIWPIPLPQIGSVRITYDAGYAAEMRPDATANTVTLINWKPLSVGDAVRFSNSGGALPAPLKPDTDYYILTAPTDGTYTLAATPGGSPIDLTDVGTGTHYGGTQICSDPAGRIPECVKSWMCCRLASLYEHREETISTKGQLSPHPVFDRLLDPVRLHLP